MSYDVVLCEVRHAGFGQDDGLRKPVVLLAIIPLSVTASSSSKDCSGVCFSQKEGMFHAFNFN
jgi:hypothetical protein